MNFNSPICLLSLVSCLATLPIDSALSAETAFVEVPPPVYGGLVKDYLQNPYGASPSVQIYVRRATDGALLTSTKTGTARARVNYAVRIPMISAASEGVVGLQYGEKATFSFLDGDILWQNLATVTTDKPGYHRLDVTLGHDANGDGIADEYAAYMLLKMAEYGVAGTAFDPEADYNHDGISNRAHYLAGTNPFAGLAVGGKVIADEKCTISSLLNVRSYAGEEFFAISFNALEEVAYSVVATDDLAKGWGEARAVASRTSVDGLDAEETHWADSAGEMTLYVPKGKAARQFYKLAIGE